MTKVEKAFWAAIEADPRDATTVLVFADWLDEHGKTDLAFAMRWAGTNCKSPKPFDQTKGTSYSWRTGQTSYSLPDSVAIYLPRSKLYYSFHLNSNPVKINIRCHYASRRDAFLALSKALARCRRDLEI